MARCLEKRCYIVYTVFPHDGGRITIKSIVEGYDHACNLLEKNKATSKKYGLNANCWFKHIRRKTYNSIKYNGFREDMQ